MLRHLIFHYHFFKNAGTSVDAFLQQNFPGQWVSKEFVSTYYLENATECQHWLMQKQHAVAFSSHTALPPPPDIAGIQVFPIIFFRHPIDRIASAYDFERKQAEDTSGSVLARQTDLKGYIEAQLGSGKYSQCRNFHLSRIKHAIDNRAPVDSAIQFIDSLPFVGLVEQYDASIARLTGLLSAYFPDVKPIAVAKNVNRSLLEPLTSKLDRIHQQVGDSLYHALLSANAEDLALFAHVQRKYPC